MVNELDMNRLFQNQRFLRDEVTFNLFYRIADGQPAVALMAGDLEAAALGSPGRGMWLWLASDVPERRGEALLEELAQALCGRQLPSVVAKGPHAQSFARLYSALEGASPRPGKSLIAYDCPQVIAPQGISGEAAQAAMEDVRTVAEYLCGFQEHQGTHSSPEDHLASAETLITGGTLSMWRAGGRVVSMANITHRARHGRINSVFTPPQHRKHGYAGALVAALSQKLLDEGLTPMLYTDANYPTSNHVYRSIGYRERGRLEEIHFQYE